MSKSLNNKNLFQRNASRSLLAVSLSMSMAAFGCTTDRTLGNGSPVTTPGVRTSPTSTPATGSETAPTVPGSMTSSSSYEGRALPTVTPRSGKVRLSPDQAAALMAQHQPQQPRVRYLGVAYPGGQQSGLGQSATGFQTGQYQNPALVTDGRLTVNSSISSAPVAAITNGAGGISDGGGVAIGGAITSSAVAGGTNNGFGAVGTSLNGGAAVIAPTSAAGLSPLGASPGARLPLGTTAAAVTPTTSPTAFSARNPDPTISSFPALGVVNSATRTNTGNALGAGVNTNATIANNNSTATIANNNASVANNSSTIGTGTTANATARATATNATAGTATGRISPVRVTRDANGRAVISNTTTRNQ